MSVSQNLVVSTQSKVKRTISHSLVCHYLPVLIEPVVSLGLGVERVAEVGWARAGNPVHGAIVHQEVVRQLLVPALVVLLHDAKVANWGAYPE